MNQEEYRIRTLKKEEISIAIKWAEAEGWNPGLFDAESFYSADPEGFFIGELNNEPIAVISAVKYGSTFGFMGFYIVKSEFRYKGYGIRIWNHGLEYLKGRIIGLDGVPAQIENYKKFGFKLAYANCRYEGVSSGNFVNDSSIMDLDQIPFSIVEEFDRKFFPDDRTEFLSKWIKQPQSVALGIMNDGTLSGYGMIRACGVGYKIGPLFAETPEIAESLFISLKSKVKPNQPVYLDVPTINKDGIKLTEKHNMKIVFDTSRMYKGDFPELPIDKIYGVTTFELG